METAMFDEQYYNLPHASKWLVLKDPFSDDFCLSCYQKEKKTHLYVLIK